MIIRAKLGTMPSGHYQVRRIVNPRILLVGAVIWIRPHGSAYHGHRWETAMIDRIDTVDGRPFYFLSRW